MTENIQHEDGKQNVNVTNESTESQVRKEFPNQHLSLIIPNIYLSVILTVHLLHKRVLAKTRKVCKLFVACAEHH